ncbi:MAG: VWA domain-containing protein [Treponema sp.]|jgi:uncharacterized protein with von Willebrand factor type A (vWA) domain|nr:VWA domain-containing protein [Treponema sp.]
MFHRFHHFIQFGAVADQGARARIAAAIYAYLLDQPGSEQGLADLANGDTGTFGPAIISIVSKHGMRELCMQDAAQGYSSRKAQDPVLAEDITKAILDFITTAQRSIQKTESPFAVEQELLAAFSSLEPEHFEDTWEGLAPFIQETYERQELDTAFYTQEFQKSLVPSSKRRRRKARASGFIGVKEHFTERWAALLAQKQRAWEQECIEAHRKQCGETLYQRIEAYRNIEALFNPFPGEPQRLWDLSAGQGPQVNFTVLHTYAKLLERDPLIQELANNVGRQETEELVIETFIDPRESDSLVEQASKADLIGVHESDDLSSIVPFEAALLADETAQWLFYQKFAEKKLQTFEYRGMVFSSSTALPKTPRTRTRKRRETRKGPCILCIDTSGSMRGIPEMVAKTLCFALLKLALKETRACYLISFSTGVGSTGMSSLHIAETLALTDLNQSLDRLSTFLSASFYGGTNAEPALLEALDLLETQEFRKADVLMVSDFIMPLPDAVTVARIKAAQEQQTLFHSLLIGDRGNKAVNHALVGLFDHQWVYEADIPALP